jgi:hypothetical protein
LSWSRWGRGCCPCTTRPSHSHQHNERITLIGTANFSITSKHKQYATLVIVLIPVK